MARKNYSKDDKQVVLDYLREHGTSGKKFEQAASKINATPQTIRNWALDAGIHTLGNRGRKKGSKSLTPEQAVLLKPISDSLKYSRQRLSELKKRRVSLDAEISEILSKIKTHSENLISKKKELRSKA